MTEKNRSELEKSRSGMPQVGARARKDGRIAIYIDRQDMETVVNLAGFCVDGGRKPWAKTVRWMLDYILSRESIGRNLSGEPHEPGAGLTLVYIPTKAINHIKGCFKDYMNLDVTDGQLAAFIEDGIYGQIGARFGPHFSEEPFEDDEDDDDDDANYAPEAR